MENNEIDKALNFIDNFAIGDIEKKRKFLFGDDDDLGTFLNKLRDFNCIVMAYPKGYRHDSDIIDMISENWHNKQQIPIYVNTDKGFYYGELWEALLASNISNIGFWSPTALRNKVSKLASEIVQRYNNYMYNAHNQHTIVMANRLKNYSRIPGSLKISPTNICLFEQAIVWGAGNSVDDIIKQITPAEAKKCLNIAVDGALAPLMEWGLIPDIVSTIDPHDKKIHLFENFPKESILHTADSIDPRLLEMAKADKHIITHTGAYPYNEPLPTNREGANTVCVTHSALYLAMRLGCKEIILVGSDLAGEYSSGIDYAPGVPQNQRRIVIKSGGEKLESSAQFLFFGQMFRQIAYENPGCKIFNASKIAMRIPEIESRDIKEFVNDAVKGLWNETPETAGAVEPIEITKNLINQYIFPKRLRLLEYFRNLHRPTNNAPYDEAIKNYAELDIALVEWGRNEIKEIINEQE